MKRHSWKGWMMSSYTRIPSQRLVSNHDWDMDKRNDHWFYQMEDRKQTLMSLLISSFRNTRILIQINVVVLNETEMICILSISECNRHQLKMIKIGPRITKYTDEQQLFFLDHLVNSHTNNSSSLFIIKMWNEEEQNA